MKRPLILGIDPGLNGAIALYNEEKNDLEKIIDIPTYKTKTSQRKSGEFRHVDIHSLAFELDVFTEQVAIAVIEDVGAMTGEEGVSSMFRFGKVCGQLQGLLAGFSLPFVAISPAVWKMSLGLTSDKDTSRALASELFPKHRHLWKLKKHNDRAEAALLAYYARKNLKNMLDRCRN